MLKIIVVQGFCPLKIKITQFPDKFCLKISPVCLRFSLHYTVTGRRTCWSDQGTVNHITSSEAVVKRKLYSDYKPPGYKPPPPPLYPCYLNTFTEQNTTSNWKLGKYHASRERNNNFNCTDVPNSIELNLFQIKGIELISRFIVTLKA